MEPVQIINCVIILAFSIGSFVISCFQFREKGYLFHNAYFWATQEERRRMDEAPESKMPYYRQSGFAFLLIGILFLVFAVYLATGWIWTLFAFSLAVIIAVVYAVVSSVKIERHQ
ncbi:MAG: DUF3784 domain-containing protein [Oscillibacter sp.]|nr:DUF3784 domain-containing protein [Oscillibacter sp.]